MENNTYNLPFYIYKINNRKVQKVRFKDIILDKAFPNSFEEVHYKEISDCYNFLMNHMKSHIDINIFIKAYFLLTNKRISKKKAYQLVSIYFQYKDCNIVELLFFLLEEINNVIHKKKLEYCLLLINYFFKRVKNEEIELYQSMFQLVRNMFCSKENMISTLVMLKRSLSYKKQFQSTEISKKEICDFFYFNKSIIKNQFLIQRLFLFGSFSEETNHQQSDLDLLVIFDDSITKDEKIMLRKKINYFIEEKLKIPTDVIAYSNSITSMDFMSLNKILTIY